jgi:16S rRNA processing protein RimM
VDETGAEVGILQDVLETPASAVYVVRGETEHLIPAVPEFIKKTDADAGLITVHLIEGM